MAPKRRKKVSVIRFRFRTMNTSGSGEVQTDWMDQDEAAIWVRTNSQIVVGFEIGQVMASKQELIAMMGIFVEEESDE